jgi:hypothetical protein
VNNVVGVAPLVYNVNSVLDNIRCNTNEILESLMKIKTDSTPGPKKVPELILRTCAESLAQSLCSLFNRLLALGTVPPLWKKANVIPIHKSVAKDVVSNNRPI